jgi:hypothetical protein
MSPPLGGQLPHRDRIVDPAGPLQHSRQPLLRIGFVALGGLRGLVADFIRRQEARPPATTRGKGEAGG